MTVNKSNTESESFEKKLIRKFDKLAILEKGKLNEIKSVGRIIIKATRSCI